MAKKKAATRKSPRQPVAPKRSSTETIISALRELARTIESADGVANAAIAEAADRLAELAQSLEASATLWLLMLSGASDDVPVRTFATQEELLQYVDSLDYRSARSLIKDHARQLNRRLASTFDVIEAHAVKMVDGVVEAGETIVEWEAE